MTTPPDPDLGGASIHAADRVPLLRRWTGAPAFPDQDAAEDVFTSATGHAGQVPQWLRWTGACTAVAYWILVVAVVPGWLRWPADRLHALLPGCFAPGDAEPDLLLRQHIAAASVVGGLLCTATVAAHAYQHRRQLAAAYAAADRRAGGLFTRRRGQFWGGVALLLAGELSGLDALATIATVTLTLAAAETARRLVVAPNRRRLAAQLGLRGLRTGYFATAAGLALVLAVHRRPTPELSTAARARLLRADPRVAAADASVDAEYRAALAASVAPSELTRLHLIADRQHLSDGSVAEALASAQDLGTRLRGLAAAWAEVAARRVSRAELETRCDEPGGETGCRALRTGTVEGSADGLLWRLTTPALAFPGAAGGWADTWASAVDVFRADGPETWRLLLHAGFMEETPEPPILHATAEGTLLRVPATMQDGATVIRTDQVYLLGAERVMLLETDNWLQAAAARLPPHACLLHTTYRDGRPVRSDIPIDDARLRASLPYGDDPARPDDAQGRLDAELGIEDGALVLRRATVAPLPDRRGWLARALGAWRHC